MRNVATAASTGKAQGVFALKWTITATSENAFFGTLEFSARTLKRRERSYDHSIVTNLLSIMMVSTDAAAGAPKGKEPSNRDSMNTLKSIK